MSNPTDQSDLFSEETRLDFIAQHMRLQTAALAEILAKLDFIGQKVTNIDSVAALLDSAVTDMRTKPNPLLKMMGMNLPAPVPGKLIH